MSQLGCCHVFLTCNPSSHNRVEDKTGRDPEKSLGSSCSRKGSTFPELLMDLTSFVNLQGHR